MPKTSARKVTLAHLAGDGYRYFSDGRASPLIRMSESAANVKCFFVPWLHITAFANTLQATGAEDKPMLGSKLSADSGAKTRPGFGEY